MASGDRKRSNETPITPKTPPEASPTTPDEIEPDTEAAEAAEAETPRMAHDSMVTVRLSEPPILSLDTSIEEVDSPDSSNPTIRLSSDDSDNTTQPDTESPIESKRSTCASAISLAVSNQNTSLQEDLEEGESEDDMGHSSDDQDEVNWEKLEKTEDEQAKDEETDNSTALLLARLEQENAKLATNPKSVKVQVAKEAAANKTRPPSMAQLRQMVHGPTPSALRYSMLPTPPTMTDLEFWAALVKDYKQTAARLPTLLSNKIHKGIPPPLRGVVWQSMSGARDTALEEQYDRFCGESSPYENIIGKDLGRSFPGVDMFRDPEGDGQRMLGRVLKSFSLYDTKIGYCQGLAFLVGPLLMHMPDKQAFCVLIRLMEHYDLRTCFLPDLSGLHVRIYQFRELLKNNLPELSSHFEELQVDPAYVSQWFLSFFAVTCPLPMLFRIYDVIFAEGASETLMRVALSLMRKNEARLLACTELEDAMQLLLSRGLWDCYGYDADDFVEDFVSLTGEVSRENLSQLEQGYRQSLVAAANASRASDISTAAARFLGRIWASSAIISPKPATLAPGAGGQSRPLSILRRSTSKQSLASTLNSVEASSISVTSSTSTNASTLSRNSAQAEEDSSCREPTTVGPRSVASTKIADEKNLHSQIEDLLTALSELQRNHTILSNQLQKEREEREEDKKVVRSLLDGLREKASVGAISAEEDLEASTPESASDDEEEDKDEDLTLTSDEADETSDTSSATKGTSEGGDIKSPREVKDISTENLSELLEQVEGRFGLDDKKRRSSMMQTKAQLRRELVQAKDQLASAMSQSQNLNRRIHHLDQELSTTKEQLRESHARVRSLHSDKQKLEKQVHGMRTQSIASSKGDAASRDPDIEPPNRSNSGGLRELKLGRSKSTPSQAGGFNKRLSSLPTSTGHESAISMTSLASPTAPSMTSLASPTTTEMTLPLVNEQEALLIELAQAKTAEAVAKQEAEEAKQKLESLRKACGLAPGDIPPATTAAGNAAMAAMGVLNRLTGQGTTPAPEPSAGGGFWGWRR